MKLVPTYRLLFLTGLILLPLTLLQVVDSAAIVPALCLASVLAIAAVLDAYRCRGRLRGMHVVLPEVIRTSKDREGDFKVQIENENLKVRHVRLGFSFPEEIFTPVIERLVELPEVNHSSSIRWLIKGLKQGCYHLDRCYIETASVWRLWLIRTAVPIHMEIRVYPNLFEEHKNLTGLFLNKGIGIHAQRQIGKGRDFEQLREYLPGDSFEDIHWKTTAKRGEPITKVYQIERTQRIYVIIDASRLSARSPRVKAAQIQGNGPIGAGNSTTMLQRFITAALIMALAAERQGDQFGLLTFDDKVRSFLSPKMGKAHFNMCRDILYTLQPQGVSPDFNELFTFIGSKIRRRALLIFLTHLDDPVLADGFTQNIDLISRHHVVLINMIKPLAARPIFSAQSVSSVDDIYRELGGHMLWRRLRETQKVLQRHGVGFAMLDSENLCTEMVSQYLSIKRRQVL